MEYKVICPICNAEVDFTYNYCPYCGSLLSWGQTTISNGTSWEDNNTGSNPLDELEDVTQRSCPKCGCVYYGGEECPLCTYEIKELDSNSTPTNAKLRDKINEIIRKLK